MTNPQREHEPGDDGPAAPRRRLAAHREHSLMALVELGRALDLRLDERDLARLALFNLVGHFGAPHAAIWLRPARGGDLEPAATVGVPEATAKSLATALDAASAVWPVGRVVRVATAGWLGGFAKSARACGLSVLARIEGQDDWLGYVALAAPSSVPYYGAFERELLSASLGIIAAAIDNQRFVHRLNRGVEQLAEANERMQGLDRLRSELLQNLNHEFRTPIAAILGAASCLRDPALQPAHRDRFVEMIEKHAAQTRDMITMLIDHAELMSVRAALECEIVDVVRCLGEVVATRKAAGDLARHALELSLPGEPLPALADPERLRRVFDELLTNALKFSPAGTVVAIRADRRTDADGDWACIEIADHGRGMTPEELELAFQLFRQADGSSTRAAGGLGLGLAASRRMLELMAGGIDLESEFGRGTTARVRLRAA